MHHCDYQNVICFDRVQDAIRKNAGEAAAHILVDNPPSFGSIDNSSDRVLDGLDKPAG